MKALRSFALLLCLSPLWLFTGASQAAQPVHAKPPVSKPTAPSAKMVAKPKPKPKPKPKAKAQRKAVSKAVAQPLPSAKLDLSLPEEMVSELKPDVKTLTPRRKRLLPSMFPRDPVVDDSPFQLNGRLISNEMQLQMRNDSRRDVEGAAIDFEFRQ